MPAYAGTKYVCATKYNPYSHQEHHELVELLAAAGLTYRRGSCVSPQVVFIDRHLAIGAKMSRLMGSIQEKGVRAALRGLMVPHRGRNQNRQSRKKPRNCLW